ncbi:hypothetical protein MycrhN_1668 [Mycolicibacterium rhodesiae NBB3]|uniref:Uncharacterized protein n=1 Tax=Mycolicibacterium rhodesiae (strain NBB3) TaxID=710685 RepID=G8RK57_MYCRN|nr:hypothetical protein MycrhN_1668 [Mycolicibacterium rhodesiae NBB3]
MDIEVIEGVSVLRLNRPPVDAMPAAFFAVFDHPGPVVAV